METFAFAGQGDDARADDWFLGRRNRGPPLAKLHDESDVVAGDGQQPGRILGHWLRAEACRAEQLEFKTRFDPPGCATTTRCSWRFHSVVRRGGARVLHGAAD